MRRRTEITVGAVSLAGLLLLFLGTMWLAGSGFGREEREIRARFREVGQLMKGAHVKLRGVAIGRVEDIALEPEGEGVLVTMRIRDDVVLPEDPVVLLSPESMFGDWQAEIYARSSLPFYSFAEAREADVLPGYSLPDMSRLTAVADRIAQNLAVLTERIEIAFTEETARNIREAIDNIQQVSEELGKLIEAQQRTAREVAGNLESATETLGEAAEAVRRAAAEVETAVAGGELTRIVSSIEQTAARADTLSALLLAASREFRTTVAAADSTVRIVGAVARSMQQGEGTLGRLAQDTTLYARLVESNALLQELLRDFKENPRKYINLRVF